MKKLVKGIVIITIIASVIGAAISIICHDMQLTAKPTTYLMVIAGCFGAVYSLVKFARLMAEKVGHYGEKSIPLWPMWAFLVFFVVEVALSVACIYLATHMWCIRDLINFELATILAGVVVYCFTHKFPQKKA